VGRYDGARSLPPREILLHARARPAAGEFTIPWRRVLELFFVTVTRAHDTGLFRSENAQSYKNIIVLHTYTHTLPPSPEKKEKRVRGRGWVIGAYFRPGRAVKRRAGGQTIKYILYIYIYIRAHENNVLLLLLFWRKWLHSLRNTVPQPPPPPPNNYTQTSHFLRGDVYE